jgi:hypothetical protein
MHDGLERIREVIVAYLAVESQDWSAMTKEYHDSVRISGSWTGNYSLY